MNAPKIYLKTNTPPTNVRIPNIFSVFVDGTQLAVPTVENLSNTLNSKRTET
jgi:hypothetical protein